ncbi:UDP-Glycosyltransferase/glycogen phosphorylase [Aspergillus indologenus CBS 114.80]|uniref:UDP-Glycosyltransferase/glycogen phosphorylase n=1 Tax=Aspergillus indologenus CBS 114.80 TaxID=1450541 RepID=A0A2V5JIG9_9EURO|nr:UDP-Glycosyltransferase/glycogen phosphorylase [Aspergillus indologenus CBS 114.80]
MPTSNRSPATPPFNILLVTNSEPDPANQTLAIAHEFLAHSHNIRVHLASFAELAPSIKQLNHDRTTHHEATFHRLPGPSKREASDKNGFVPQNAFHGHSRCADTLRTYTQLLPQSRIPWTGPEYVTLYNHIGILVADIFPLVIVVDATLAPGVDVCRTLKWRHVLVGSGLAHEYLPPSPGRVSVLRPRFLVLKNLILGLLLRLGTTHSPHLQHIQTARRARGLTGPIPDPRASHPQPGDERPLLLLPTDRTYDPIPAPASSRIIHCGPITLPLRPIGKTHPDLALWLRQRPTVLITLGAETRYPAREQIAFATAITAVLAAQPLAQVLWLMKPEPTHSGVPSCADGLMDATVLRLKAQVSPRHRLRIYGRLPAETTALLASGNVGCVVHRGEARVFGEAVRAGIPQIVLPMDLADYEYAQRVEDLGVGVGVGGRGRGKWAGGRVTAEQVERAMLRVLDGEAGENMRERAEALAVRLLRRDGRVVAHERVLEMIGLRRMS